MNPLIGVSTEALLGEIMNRYDSLVVVGVLVNENTAAVGGAHVCHHKGASAQAIGLTVLAQDFLRKRYALALAEGNPYG